MSDFLSKLASRSLDSKQGIRPRLAALFEPPSGHAVGFQRGPESGAVSHGTGIDEFEIAITDREAADDAESAPPSRRRRKRGVSNDGVIHEDREGQMPVQDLPEDEQRMVPIRQPRDLSRSSKMQDRHPQTIEPPKITVTVAKPEGRLAEPPSKDLGVRAPVAASPKPSLLPEEMGRLLPAVLPSAIFPERFRIDRHPADSEEENGKSNSGNMQALSQRRLHERRTMPSPATEPEPMIQVTIGRVEVRAELLETSSRHSKQQASPVMGLDEYLRRRSKRGGE